MINIDRRVRQEGTVLKKDAQAHNAPDVFIGVLQGLHLCSSVCV